MAPVWLRFSPERIGLCVILGGVFLRIVRPHFMAHLLAR
jgi:hypothetical protein